MAEVEILYFAGCPAYRRAREHVVKAMGASGFPGKLEMVLVRHDRDARTLDFHGSPTVRVGGRDIDPEGLARVPEVGLFSRSYRWERNEFDVPPEAMVRQALLRSGRPAP